MNPFPPETRAHELYERIRAQIPRLALGAEPTRASASPDWAAELGKFDDRALLGAEPADRPMASCVRSGLLLRADLLDASHTVSQQIPTSTGSYWHGIMHRREGDFGNSKYWFHRVGAHPAFAILLERVRALELEEAAELASSERWRPDLFIDLCAARHDGPLDALRDELERIQDTELDVLLEWSFARAVGS